MASFVRCLVVLFAAAVGEKSAHENLPQPLVPRPDTCATSTGALTSGDSHTCALLTDGTVRCWGANYQGQLGDGTMTFRSAPVRVEGLSDVTAIAAGGRHTCALLREGTVWCWGDNESGQLGKKPVAHIRSLRDLSVRPVSVGGAVGIAAIAAAERHTLALGRDGRVYLWGQTGREFARNVREPFAMSLPPIDAISAGIGIDCAFGKGRAFCWGSDLRLFGHATQDKFDVVELGGAGGLNRFVIGHATGCGINPQGSVHCWGERGYLGSAPPVSRRAAYGADVVVGGLPAVVGLASRWQTCAVTMDGRVACWGRNAFPGGGDGNGVNNGRPAWVTSVTNAAEVAVGESSTCVRTRDGRVLCWGDNGYGQLGDATTEARARPAEVQFCADKAEPIFFEPPAGVPLVAALQRTMCLGSCPVYSVRVYEDGTVIYRGDWYVSVRGGRKAKLSRAELNGLRATFRRARFLHLPYVCNDAATDNPTVRLFFADKGKARLLSHYHGCNSGGPPSPFTTLENEVDRLLGTARWVGEVNDGLVDIGATEGELIVPGVPVEPPDL